MIYLDFGSSTLPAASLPSDVSSHIPLRAARLIWPRCLSALRAQELVSTGETKAENTITWARNALKQRGYITRAAPRGVWELTAAGKETAGKVALPKPR